MQVNSTGNHQLFDTQQNSRQGLIHDRACCRVCKAKQSKQSSCMTMIKMVRRQQVALLHPRMAMVTLLIINPHSTTVSS